MNLLSKFCIKCIFVLFFHPVILPLRFLYTLLTEQTDVNVYIRIVYFSILNKCGAYYTWFTGILALWHDWYSLYRYPRLDIYCWINILIKRWQIVPQHACQRFMEFLLPQQFTNEYKFQLNWEQVVLFVIRNVLVPLYWF